MIWVDVAGSVDLSGKKGQKPQVNGKDGSRSARSVVNTGRRKSSVQNKGRFRRGRFVDGEEKQGMERPARIKVQLTCCRCEWLRHQFASPKCSLTSRYLALVSKSDSF
jgi:hypothetical protein